MSSKVNLLLKANTNVISDTLAQNVENAISKSCCWVLGKLSAENGLQFQIRAFSEKLEKLQYELTNTGIELAEDAGAMISNAASQYSVFRDIEVTLIVNEVPFKSMVT
jgi:tRNA A37 threonylcarbamoyltransferase TsaD